METTSHNTIEASGTNLSSIELRRPELWTLALAIHAHKIDFLIYCDEEAESLKWGSVPLDAQSAGSPLKAIEDVVYDNPVLLSPFKKVSILIHSEQFMLMPAAVGNDDESALTMMETLYGDDHEYCFAPVGNTGATIGFATPEGVQAFLQRTFGNPTISHAIAPLCAYEHSRLQPLQLPRMVLAFEGNKMHACAFRQQSLVLANSFTVRSATDAVYFAMHLWQNLGMDVMNHELHLAGDKAMREAVAPLLRKYINYVMPIIFPAAALRLGKDSLKAPLNLVMLALCE